MPNTSLTTGKIPVEEVVFRTHGTASMHRMGPSGRRLVGEGLATLRGVRQDDESMRVSMTISWLDVYGIDLNVSREAWSRCLDVGYLRRTDPLGEVILHADGEATEWEVRPDGRWPVAQDQGTLHVVDTGTVFRVALALRLGTALEMDLAREEWSRAVAEASRRLAPGHPAEVDQARGVVCQQTLDADGVGPDIGPEILRSLLEPNRR